jgi:hypothetical protein
MLVPGRFLVALASGLLYFLLYSHVSSAVAAADLSSAVPARPLVVVPSRSRALAAASYTVHDVGMPSVTFNNANQILYVDPQFGAAVYNVGTGVKTVIPVSAPNCRSRLATPLSMNDKDEVLGFVACPLGTVYFTWDPAGGTKFLSAEIPSNPYTITPLGVNDNGQILIQLTSSTYVNSWGTLDPIAPKASGGRPRNTIVRAK